MYLSTLNWGAIIVAMAANMVIGGMWYSPAVAGRAWMALTNFDKTKAAAPMPAMAKSTLAAFIVAIMLAGLIEKMNYYGALPGALTGLLLAVFFIGPAIFPNYAFENRPVKLFLVHMGNTSIAIAAMGAIIGAWR